MEAALDAWRHKASDILLAVLAAVFLPVVVLVILGYSPPVTLLVRSIVVGAYLPMCAAALFRRFQYRRRVELSLLALYVVLFIAFLVNPQGPDAQIGVITFPIYALVLLGYPAARIAFVVSSAFIVSAPLLRQQPILIHLLGIDLTRDPRPPDTVWFRAAVEAASLFVLMVLLARFHRFFMRALTQRIAAQRKMEVEMNERHRLEREIAAVSDGERQRLGQELHDGVCQQVTAALLHCQVLERRLERGGELSDSDFAPLSELLAETIDDAHDVSRGLCPLEPDPDALAPALRSLVQRTQQMAAVRCEFRATGDVHVDDPEAAQHLYRIAQEALSNAARHGRPKRILVELCARDGHLTLQIEDNGEGLPEELADGGMGLRTMAYRAQMMKGELKVQPVPGGGTRVVCRVPNPVRAKSE